VQTKTTAEQAAPRYSEVVGWVAAAQPAVDLDRNSPEPSARPAAAGSPCWDLCPTCSQLVFAAAAAEVVDGELANDQAVAAGLPGVAEEEPAMEEPASETAAASDIAEAVPAEAVGFEYVSFSCQYS